MITWPATRAAEALEALARKSGLRPKHVDIAAPSVTAVDSAYSSDKSGGGCLPCFSLKTVTVTVPTSAP